MKKTAFLLILLMQLSVFGQNKPQWHAVYQYKQILSEKEKARRDSLVKAQPAMAEMIKNLYKKFDNRTFIMDFTREESLYKEEMKLDNPGKNTRFIGMKDKKLYKNLKKGIYLYKRPMIDEVFIVSDSLPVYKWKIGNESKTIGQYTVIKAEAVEPEDSTKKITAWFSPEIPVQNGPDKYWGLPGLIMEISNGKALYLLKEIVINPQEKVKILPPTGGKIVDEKTYKEETKKMREELRKRYKNRRGDKSSHTIEIRM